MSVLRRWNRVIRGSSSRLLSTATLFFSLSLLSTLYSLSSRVSVHIAGRLLDGRRRRDMRKSFKDSIKTLEADIQHANTLASGCPREHDGACLQMRLNYCPAAHFFLFLVQWTDCRLAGALGLVRVLIHTTYSDGKTTMGIYERKASIRQFYGVIYPSLLQLQEGITDSDDRRQRELCSTSYTIKEDDELKLPETDSETGGECGICMEVNGMVILPNCSHALCLMCFRDWRRRSQSCPFCRDSLKRVSSGDLWIYTDNWEIDLSVILRENAKMLFMFIEKLPLIVPHPSFAHSPYEINHN